MSSRAEYGFGKGSGKGGGKGKGKGKGVPRTYWREKPAAETASAAQQAAPPPAPEKRLIGFDWDCTLTVRHFYKVFAWGYASRNSGAHAHCQDFEQCCKKRGAPTAMVGRVGDEDPMSEAVEDFCKHAGEEAFREVFREVFLGGEERILLVAEWLKKMQDQGVVFAIVTAGISAVVLRALTAVPEWLPFFNSSRIWDTSQSRHTVNSVAGSKALILRDICPEAKRILLVDDSLCRDAPPPWVLRGASVETMMDLPYEGPGLTEDLLKTLEEAVMR